MQSRAPIPAPPPTPTQKPAVPLPPPGKRVATARLTVIVEDGSEGKTFLLEEAQVDIGRNEGVIRLEDDPYVSPRHARFFHENGRWFVRDLASTNGVYSRLRKTQPLRDGDLLLLGLEVVQFQTVSDAERGLGPATQHGTMLFG
jgi:pSer/pThr/pTyr-binding forkhead associated (FHA) protein